MYVYMHIYVHVIHVYVYVHVYIFILTLSAFCINVKFVLITQGGIFLKSVIFRILRIFNGLLKIKIVKKYLLTE